MKLVKINPNHMSFYSRHFIKGFECGAKRQLEADKRSIPKGRWLNMDGEPTKAEYAVYCSECTNWSEYASNYCMNCGADMRGEGDDE